MGHIFIVGDEEDEKYNINEKANQICKQKNKKENMNKNKILSKKENVWFKE